MTFADIVFMKGTGILPSGSLNDGASMVKLLVKRKNTKGKTVRLERDAFT